MSRAEYFDDSKMWHFIEAIFITVFHLSASLSPITIPQVSWSAAKKWYPFNQCEIQMSFSIRITSNMKLPARWLLFKLLLECLISAMKLIFLLFLLLSQKLYCFVNFVKLYVNLNLSKSKNQQIISQLKGRQMQKMVAPPKKFVN